MGFSYNKLWKLALDNNLNKTQLRDYIGISNGSLSKLSKNEPISMETIGNITMHFFTYFSNRFHTNWLVFT